ncbi:glutamate--tRNA ligase [bacterium SCSIO 12741]|nr:glutamate--tRNA ligase [bacterium SCSIO 12741]
MENVRVRFAPSPTGPLHMGGVRTALYNYLFAKKHGGTFILRIEDTDQTRYVPGAEDYIVEALDWCGLLPDESPSQPGSFGPYRQSERKEAGMYRQFADQLVENGHAYYAFDTPEELDAVREQAKQMKMPNWQYNSITRNSMRNSLTLSKDETQQLLDEGTPYVIRLKAPRNEEIRIDDLIRGWVVVNTSNIDDKVILKADGMPTYHLANVVDDHLMKITHVIRGEEWLPSAPTHVLLYRYLGWEEEMPRFAHLPLILKPDGNGKLSKRDGDRLGFPVFPLEWHAGDEVSSGYREKGYFPEAFINMLAFLGWNPGDDRELFTLTELIEAFSLERVGKAGAKFDADKTKWYNQQYLRKKDKNELAALAMPLAQQAGYDVDEVYLAQVCELMKERATFISDLVSESFYFTAPTEYDEKTRKKKWKEDTPSIIGNLRQILADLPEFNAESIDAAFHQFLEANGYGFGKVMPGFRLLVTGKGMGPSMSEISALLGKEEVLNRIDTGLNNLANA